MVSLMVSFLNYEQVSCKYYMAEKSYRLVFLTASKFEVSLSVLNSTRFLDPKHKHANTRHELLGKYVFKISTYSH